MGCLSTIVSVAGPRLHNVFWGLFCIKEGSNNISRPPTWHCQDGKGGHGACCHRSPAVMQKDPEQGDAACSPHRHVQLCATQQERLGEWRCTIHLKCLVRQVCLYSTIKCKAVQSALQKQI